MGVYRLHIHPLSRFPGPRLAAMTGLYEIYFAARGEGSFEHEIRRLHREYGPVVRITPDEVHVQEQPMNLTDCWVKGASVGEVREKQRERDRSTSMQQHQQRLFLIRKRQGSPVRSLLLRVEVDYLLAILVQRHGLHRLVSSRSRTMPRTGHRAGVSEQT
ncbi:hypothetical protein N7474_005550 [Penicillium riverlandense]|uniref:uncharacterized protein n=1 Tax=Penicillium riverlandense TaxID=1903569 RepID=UPI002548FB44|nr:uncharacterized protein N7474_005550 [Penicillium riverlandense]KAJ5819959.1 hypothetical protein N7474_005550 [Penicillium riverlandense]